MIYKIYYYLCKLLCKQQIVAEERERSMKRFVTSIILCLILWLGYSQALYAKEIPSVNKGLDVMFVIDSSGSMKSNDPNKMAMDMVKAFIDTVHIENIRIGFVSYNNKIVSSSAPISIVQEEERKNLKSNCLGHLYFKY